MVALEDVASEIEHLGTNIKKYQAKKEISNAEMAKRLNISRMTLYRRFHDKQWTIEQLTRFIEISKPKKK
jgi:predicted transcriptional regulator